ncbi:DUF1376 domain-containing protein [Paracoccus angustae]|uniref:DUF1376 domain-containing protein n=1 Tax=Paracoccus angustae TaxID=1671480 RepID=A0ABV7TZU2_9RHOB
MSSKSHMPLHVVHFLGGTVGLSTEALGAYTILSAVAFDKGGWLPEWDLARLARVCRLSKRRMKAALDEISSLNLLVYEGQKSTT